MSFLDWELPPPSVGSATPSHRSSGPALSSQTPSARRATESRKQNKEIERLQELLRATEIVAESNEKRVKDLERELGEMRGRAQTQTARSPLENVIQAAMLEAKSPVKNSDAPPSAPQNLHTEDSAAFDKYLQRLVEEERVRLGIDQNSQRQLPAGPTVKEKDSPPLPWMYKVTIASGLRQPTAISAAPYIILNGSLAQSGPLELKGTFTPGVAQSMIVPCKDVGEILSVRVGHNNFGPSPLWHIDSVSVSEPFGATYSAGVDFVIPKDDPFSRCFVDVSNLDVQINNAKGIQRAKSATPQIPKKFIDLIRYIHEDSTHGLLPLSRSLGANLEIPKSARKNQILILGSGHGPQRVAEALCGIRISNGGIGTENNLTWLTQGGLPGVVKGPGVLEDVTPGLMNVIGVAGGQCCVRETVASSAKFLLENDLIIGPNIDGPAANGTDQQKLFQRVRQKISENSVNLRTQFQRSDKDGSGTVDRHELRDALASLKLGLRDSEVSDLFSMLDATGDGELEYDEFLNAFRMKHVEYPYELENGIGHIATHADLILCFLDPKVSRFNLRELRLFADLRRRFKSKSHFMFYLPALQITQTNIADYAKATSAAIAAECKDISLQKLQSFCFIPTDLPVGAVPTTDNVYPLLPKLISDFSLAKKTACVADLESNLLALVHHAGSNKNKQKDSSKSQEENARAAKKEVENSKNRISETLRVWVGTLAKAEDPTARKMRGVFEGVLRVVREGPSATAAITSDSNLRMWTSEQVGVWLQKHGLGQYLDAATAHSVNGRMLVEMCAEGGEGLKERLGMSLGHRKELVKKIRAMTHLR